MNPHIASPKSYVIIWAVLMVLLFVTWGLAEINLQPLNVIVALIIAFAKMGLVIFYFMHVRLNPRVTWVFVAAGFIWFLIMVNLTLSDYLTRGIVPSSNKTWIKPER